MTTRSPRFAAGLASAIIALGFVGMPSAAAAWAVGPTSAPAPLAPTEQGVLELAGSLTAAGSLGSGPSDTPIQRSQLAVAAELLPTLEHQEPGERSPRPDAAISSASTALEHRTNLLGAMDEAPALAGLQQQARNLDAAEQVLGAHGDQGGLAEAIEQVRILSSWQSDRLALAETEGPQPPSLASPSEGVDAIAQTHGAAIPASSAEVIEALDELPDPLTSQLRDTLAAFLAFDAATEAAFGDVDPAPPLRQAHPPADTAASATPSLAHGDRGQAAVLDARATLLDEIHQLERVLGATDADALETSGPVRVPGAIALDLAGEASTYTDDYALVIDADGDDTYHNNAGGSNLAGGGCSLEESAGAAALVDLGGDDAFGDPADRRFCGANGGAYTGAGLLVDVGGSDAFFAGSTGTNGGATSAGLGLVVSVGGSDVFDAYSFGTNGGGSEAAGAIVSVGGNDTYEGGSLGSNGAGTGSGVGAIVDTDGSDRYHAGIIGANGAGDGYLLGTGGGFIADLGDHDDVYASSGGNGGGSRKGVGFLFDGGGEDRFLSHAFGTNGGGQSQGVGMLVSADGRDLFDSDYTATNGGASSQGVGFLVNLGGGSTYVASYESEKLIGGGQGVNGGATSGGVGFLLDAGGGSGFEANAWGANGGAHEGGVGLLLAGGGDDAFQADSLGTNGGSSGGDGLLVDVGGDDRYEAGDAGANGGADGDGSGGILDLAGDDTYRAEGGDANGAASDGGLALLLDAAGDDVYRSDSAGNGYADPLSYALLLDGQGTDRYEDSETDCWDCSQVPKGALGAQLDLSEGAP